jgi:UDP-N-acetylmuramoyl-L-alanyl-D-glutamate--2,6-diaminopimelate ligase
MIDLARLREAVDAELVGAGSMEPVLISGLSYDSRHVKPRDLFFCVRGEKSDGHRFLSDAIARGAVAAVVDQPGPFALPVLRVPDVRAAMPLLSAAFHHHPARKLSLVGVTGTNGKTTTAFLIAALARAAGRGAGVIGTIGARINDEQLPGDRTTPESPDLQGLLARMAAADPGAGMVVAMEVSSHALSLERTVGCEFDVGVFTNLTQDHLDFHGDMESYFQAKVKLFTEYPSASGKPFVGVVNTDDPYGRRLAELSAGRVLSYGLERSADLRASDIHGTARELTYRLDTPEGDFEVHLRLGGLFNVYNSLAAMGAARALGIPWSVILPAIGEATGVPGRFESVVAEGVRQEYSVIVDYAHSPDGLENVLRSARALEPRRVISVFGCGGDRDRTKRPIMGRIAAELSDLVIVTSDNPRSEEPAAILADIVAGIPAERAETVRTVVDRRTAIREAVAAAQPGDLVVIAGKGHETYQIFARETIHFDDREEARAAIHDREQA